MVKWLKKYSFNGSKALALVLAVAAASGDGTGQIFAQEATLGAPADVAEIDGKLGAFAGRISRDNWIDQAKYLEAGDVAGFEKKYGALGGEVAKG